MRAKSRGRRNRLRGLGAQRERVSVIGDFNDWTDSRQSIAAAPEWGLELFVPEGFATGALYKYGDSAVQRQRGCRQAQDALTVWRRPPPRNAESIVWHLPGPVPRPRRPESARLRSAASDLPRCIWIVETAETATAF